MGDAMTAPIIPLGTHRAMLTGNNSDQTPADCLRDALNEISSGERQCTSLLVLTLNAGDGQFGTGWYAANLRSSEMVALVEIVKLRFLAQMGIVEGRDN
mgnify:CR=1 FL=1